MRQPYCIGKGICSNQWASQQTPSRPIKPRWPSMAAIRPLRANSTPWVYARKPNPEGQTHRFSRWPLHHPNQWQHLKQKHHPKGPSRKSPNPLLPQLPKKRTNKLRPYRSGRRHRTSRLPPPTKPPVLDPRHNRSANTPTQRCKMDLRIDRCIRYH